MKTRRAGILQKRSQRRIVALVLGVLAGGGLLVAPWPAATHPSALSVRGVVELLNVKTKGRDGRVDKSGVVVWLETTGAPIQRSTRKRQVLSQKGKRFNPHILVTEVGAQVDFPNEDPFFHNVFSVFDGRRFDLGLYASGETRPVNFNRPGISYIFCNIHPQMSAIVIALETPFHAVTDQNGAFLISGVPTGRYRLELWHERSTQEHLATFSREIQIGQNDLDLGALQLTEAGVLLQPHQNKYGEEYDPRRNRPAYRKP